MKTISSHLEPPSAFPSSATISESTRTLLVVDDDPLVRQAEVQLLCDQGYTVLQAEGAAKALRLAREATAIHLLITEFSMPEVNGLELARRFRAVHPKAPILMVSGSLPPVHDSADDLGRFELLAKPFRLGELLHKVRNLLSAVAPEPVRRPWCCD